MLKDERLDHAFSRILLREVGWTGTRDKAGFIGVYEHFYPANFAGSPGVTTHYVALAYRLIVPDPLAADRLVNASTSCSPCRTSLHCRTSARSRPGCTD